MKKTPFILHEKFRSDNNEQRKERFQKEFERYIIDEIAQCRSFKILRLMWHP